MGKIELDHTGSGSGITLSSDGTDLLLNGTAVGGGGTALELYAENPSSPTAPSATGTNAVAIGSGAVASQENNIALGQQANANGNSRAIAIGYLATSSANYSLSAGPFSDATGTGSTALGWQSQAISGAYATALTNSYASGTASFAAAISSNSSSYGATGANSVAIGSAAKATANNSIAIGTSNTASGIGSVVIGGSSTSIASGTNSVAIGNQATASGSGSVVISSNGTGWGSEATQGSAMAFGDGAVSNIRGKYAFASGSTTVSRGLMQSGFFNLTLQTTNDTPQALTTYNYSSANATNQIILPNNSAHAFHGTIVARQQASAGTACAAWKVEGLIRREGSAGTTVLVNSATTVLDNTPAWGMTLSADTTNGGLAITVTGAAATNIRWVATIHTSEVTY